ncbi:glucose-6-phosphate isomerase [Candidatus Peribacteria bacterium]|nr:glucose-6-phosphate isomerase [Candidatus Peribacteria bacterium]
MITLTTPPITPYGTDATLASLLGAIAARGQGFASCIDDTALLRDIQTYAAAVEGRYSDIVVLGIGGSALGARTIRNALVNPYQSTVPRLHVVDTIDPQLLQDLSHSLPLSSTLFLVISKSGHTTETLSQYCYFRHRLLAARLPLQEHMLFITDPLHGVLRPLAEAEGIRAFPIPPNVGGRFSVLTAVGLLPAALLGVDITAMLSGASAIRERFLSSSVAENTCYQYACVLHQQAEAGRNISVLMPYSKRLQTLGSWYAQLLAESTGKRTSAGQHVGLTPVAAMGPTDQHSQLQLYAEGPDDKQFTFLTIATQPLLPIMAEQHIPWQSHLSGVDFAQLLHAEYQATRDSLQELGRPVSTLTIPQLDARTLGALFFFLEGTVALLGEMLGINAFDQPGVERSKELTRQYLQRLH